MVNLNAEVTTSFQDQAKKNTKEEHENGLMKTNKSFKKLDLRDYDYAEFKYEMLQNQIRDFQNSLSDEFDVCVKFISYGDKIIQIENISYQNPDLLYFYGYLDKKKIQIIQHVTQLNFMLIAFPKLDNTKQPNRIGFIVNN